MIEIKFVDLFAGIGGFRQAALQSSINDIIFKPVGSCEIDENCRKMYSNIFNLQDNNETFVNDINDILKGDRDNPIGITKLQNFDLLFGGFPCQPFSNVGTRKGLEDPRGVLFRQITLMLRYYQPKFFILENVQKISTIDGGNVLNIIINELENENYHVHVFNLYANDYGLPQKRQRMFFCGINKEFSKEKRNITEPRKIPCEKWKYPTVWHLLEHKMPSEHIIPEKTRKTVLRKNDKWQGELAIDRAIAAPLTATMAKWHRANQDNYYSATYVAHDNKDPYTAPEVDWQQEPIRRITPLEGFRIQGFPDEYELVRKQLKISFTATYKMIGNAVPVNLAKAVIEHFIGIYT